jgi:methionyl-tRNA synthetase
MENTSEKKKFYITAPIFYPNGDLHIGHAYTATVCDVFARMSRLDDRSTYFLTGVDENSLKIQKKADELDMDVMDYLDDWVKKNELLFERLNISHDQYIRTTDKIRHHPGVIAIWNKLNEKGDIYENYYEGYYCVGCEGFKTEKDLVDGVCPDHGIKPDFIKEKNYFFRLSKYTNQIKKVIEDDIIKIFPQSRKNEVLSFLEQGLEDISFSRPYKGQKNVILVPGDESQGIYVWGDALVNYISALGYGSLGQSLDESLYNLFWNNKNSETLHVIGKDILKFHSIIWPAMLMSAEIPLPKNILIHGLMQSGGRKMSKTIGNTISPTDIMNKIGAEGLRFYFTNNIPVFDDGEITEDLIISNYNSGLANGLGNLTNRLIKMMISYDVVINLKEKFKESELYKNNSLSLKKVLQDFNINEYTNILWKQLSTIDNEIQTKEPFKLFKTDPDEARKIVEQMVRDFYTIIHFIQPILPKTVAVISEHIESREMPEKSLFPKVEKEL